MNIDVVVIVVVVGVDISQHGEEYVVCSCFVEANERNFVRLFVC